MSTFKILSTLILFAAVALAQTQTATLRGKVTDHSGAVIPSVQVTLTNTEQDRSWNASTNNEGVYSFVQIPPVAPSTNPTPRMHDGSPRS